LGSTDEREVPKHDTNEKGFTQKPARIEKGFTQKPARDYFK